jgi:sodium-independent sulfate anion transporter 11
MSCFVYAVLGSCKDVTVGPTGIMTLMTMAHSARHPGYAPLLTFFAGIIITLCGIFHLG